MSTREVLPQRRLTQTFAFFHQNIEYTASVGYYDDGRIGEVFLTATKSGTALDIATRDNAVLLSFALQHGCSLETIQSALTRGEKGEPHGAIGVLVDKILNDPDINIRAAG